MNGYKKKPDLYRAGLIVFVLLAALTVGEYFVSSISSGWALPLLGIALLKAVLILRDYMHLPRLFTGEKEIE